MCEQPKKELPQISFKTEKSCPLCLAFWWLLWVTGGLFDIKCLQFALGVSHVRTAAEDFYFSQLTLWSDCAFVSQHLASHPHSRKH